MSVNPDMNESTDYGDFRFQQVQFEHKDRTADGANSQSTIVFEVDPLESMGGLQTNEVAELVYMETQVSLEYEDETDDQDVGASVEYRGSVGANLDAKADEVGSGNTAGDVTIIDASGGSDTSTVRTQAKDEVFQSFRLQGNPPFDDETNGPGGSGDNQTVVYEKNWRQLTGRGPVLDANDDISQVSRLILADHIIPISALTRLHLVWDTAEVDEAGRAFSVPR